jgi:hypothetical protein
MKGLLVFIDGTISDGQQRYGLFGKPDFYQRENILSDQSVQGSAQCLQELARRYTIVYIGARPAFTQPATQEWLEQEGFPAGPVYLAETQEERLALVRDIGPKYDFIAGIGDRWDDNELHAALGCLSIILQEHAGRWDSVAGRIDRYYRQRKVRENEIRLRGKIEGLARLCSLLHSRYGDKMWETFHAAVMEMAERTRAERREEDLASFAKYDLDPADLRDVARWDVLLREEDWENDSAYGLQEHELVEAAPRRYEFKVTRCMYAELWKEQGKPEFGYQIHCRNDAAWWDRPAWNPEVRFEQPKTLMQGDECCVFVQYLPGE